MDGKVVNWCNNHATYDCISHIALKNKTSLFVTEKRFWPFRFWAWSTWWLLPPIIYYIIIIRFLFIALCAYSLIVFYTTQDYTDLLGAGQAEEQAFWGAENPGERVRCTSGCPAVQRSAHDVVDMRFGKSKYHCSNRIIYLRDIGTYNDIVLNTSVAWEWYCSFLNKDIRLINFLFL